MSLTTLHGSPVIKRVLPWSNFALIADIINSPLQVECATLRILGLLCGQRVRGQPFAR
jgi:hypothetical protein